MQGADQQEPKPASVQAQMTAKKLRNVHKRRLLRQKRKARKQAARQTAHASGLDTASPAAAARSTPDDGRSPAVVTNPGPSATAVPTVAVTSGKLNSRQKMKLRFQRELAALRAALAAASVPAAGQVGDPNNALNQLPEQWQQKKKARLEQPAEHPKVLSRLPLLSLSVTLITIWCLLP